MGFISNNEKFLSKILLDINYVIDKYSYMVYGIVSTKRYKFTVFDSFNNFVNFFNRNYISVNYKKKEQIIEL